MPPAQPAEPRTVELSVHGIAKRYGSHHVLAGVDLVARAGEVTALLGHNGAGKSTLFRILMGLIHADAGTARLGDVDVMALPLHQKARAGLGYLPQDAASFPELTVAGNLRAVLELHVGDRRVRPRRLVEILHRVGLGALADRRSAVLSAGERRRLELGKVLAASPRLLLLDEPFAGLDPQFADGLGALLRELAAGGVGVLLTDHNVHSTLQHADRVLVLARGAIRCRGTPDEIRADAEARRLYLGESFGP